MKRLLTLGLLLLSTTSLFCQDTWVKTLGGSNDDWGESVDTMLDGDILVTGFTNSSDGDFAAIHHDHDYGLNALFVVKLDENGRVLWKKLFDGTDEEPSNRVSTTTSDGGVVVAGGTDSNNGDFKEMVRGGSDIFVIRLDKDGRVRWKKTFGGSLDEGSTSLTTASDGSILVTGYTLSEDGDFKGMNKGGSDVFVIKLDKDGNVLWKNTFGGSAGDVGRFVTTASDGGVLIAGSTESNDGDFQGMNHGRSDMFIMKLDSNGNLRSQR